jgi:hypothetical protein
VEAKEIFDAAPLSVSQFLSQPGQGHYIPAYQRAYSWEQAKVGRLLGDINHGVQQLRDMDDSICFLGSVIALHDTNNTAVEPIYRSQVPSRVMTIIDGQQRLTSLLIILTVLHEEIAVRAARQRGDSVVAIWCRNHAADVTGRLAMTFEEDMRYGAHQFYPRLVRAYADVWSRNHGEARYTSPIGYYLEQYGAFARAGDFSRAYNHNAFDDASAEHANLDAHGHLQKIRDYVRRELRRQARAEQTPDGVEAILPQASEIAESRLLQEELFNTELPPEIIEALADDTAVSALVRLLVFAEFLLQRVTVAVITAKREDYGFDMFEALNTTGQPLTALETFKPRVIEKCGLAEWKDSRSKQYFDIIEAYLDREGAASADKRQVATSKLLIPFALVQSGARESNRLNDQRRHLHAYFAEETDSAGREEFLSAMAQVVHFISGPWEDASQLPAHSDSQLTRQAELALRVLRDANHDITIAPLVRYHARYRLGTTDTEDAAESLLRATRACSAFFALWRGAHGTTSGIDDVYRKIMGGDEARGLPAFARRQGSLLVVPPVEMLCDYFRHRLDEAGIGDRESWASRMANVPVYKASRPLARLLLLAASDDSMPDGDSPGLIKRGRVGLLDLLNSERWSDDTLLTLEHIAPQENRAGDPWDPTLYQDDALINSLGNLTLLPATENSSAGNRSWETKRVLYRLYSAPSVEDAEQRLSEALGLGLQLNRRSQDIAHNARYLPLVSALTEREDWTASFIRERSIRLGELAWDRLAPWLGLSLVSTSLSDVPAAEPATAAG